MKFLTKNKIIPIIVIVLIVLGAVAFVIIKKSSSQAPSTEVMDETQNVKAIKPEDIGLALDLEPDKKNVKMVISKLTGIKSVEYELSYDAEETTDGETSIVPKGAVGSPIDVNGESEIKREILLGTCSSSVCRYDKVKSDIKVVVKVNYTNGEVGSAEATVTYK